MKHIALILFGLSYFSSYRNPSSKEKFVIDFRNSVENYNKYIFDYYKKKGFEIDVFIATNNHSNKSIKKKLLDIYQPKKYLFIDDNPKDNFRQKRNKKVQHGLDLCIKYANETNVKYDFVLLTRFDLNFKLSFDKININYNTINNSSRLNLSKKGEERIDDNFYIIPYTFIKSFKKIVDKTINRSSHLMIDEVEKLCKVNFFFTDKRLLVRTIPLFDIIRNKIEIKT